MERVQSFGNDVNAIFDAVFVNQLRLAGQGRMTERYFGQLMEQLESFAHNANVALLPNNDEAVVEQWVELRSNTDMFKLIMNITMEMRFHLSGEDNWETTVKAIGLAASRLSTAPWLEKEDPDYQANSRTEEELVDLMLNNAWLATTQLLHWSLQRVMGDQRRLSITFMKETEDDAEK